MRALLSANPKDNGAAGEAVPIPTELAETSTNKVPLSKFASPATAKVLAISTAPSMSTTSRLVVPSTSRSVPTYNFLAIPTPPSTIKAPEVELVESVTRFKLTAPLVSRVVTVAAAAAPDPRIPSSVPVNPVAVI